jgi:hypothetical protein
LCRSSCLTHLQHDLGVLDVAQDRDQAEGGDHFAQKLDTLAGEIGRLGGQSGDVATRSRQTCNQPAADRVARQHKDDRDGRCRLLCCGGRGNSREDDVNLKPDKLGRDLDVALGTCLRPAILDCDGATLNPAQLAHSLCKRGGPLAHR